MGKRRVKKKKVVIKGTGAPAEPIIEGMVPLKGWVIIGRDSSQHWNGWKVYAFEPEDRSAIAVTITQGHPERDDPRKADA